ncbi:Regulator of chromosome condensation [Papilio xuthus]|uniref:Regulator of chromosome condensation n=1 Tax=Papilio xuthus TaxID=66420 RepID=A0A0N1PF11_PAPXU|nr:Regulator of chromosome condensation [Papilio xuthus]
MQFRTPAPGHSALAQGVWGSSTIVRPYPVKPLRSSTSPYSWVRGTLAQSSATQPARGSETILSEAFSWGMGSEGQLGTGAAADASEPTPPTSAPFDTRKSIRVSAGGQHTVLLLEETKELSPPPENKVEMETVEETAEEQEPEEEKVEKKRPAKRQKKQEQDEEISSTSTAQSAETKPEVTFCTSSS